MSKQKKLPCVTVAVAKRASRANFRQDGHGLCIICGGAWSDCGHDLTQAGLVIQAVQLAEMLGLELAE